MSILLLAFLAFKAVSINSKIISQKFVDSLIANLPDTLSDSAVVEFAVRTLFEYLEDKGVIDPQIEVLVEECGITLFVKDERIVPISKVYVDVNGNLRSYSYLNNFLKNGIFSRERFLWTSSFFSRLEFFEVFDYRFLKRMGKYDLVLGTRNLDPLPILTGGFEKGIFWLRSLISYSNLYYFPFRFSIDFSILGRSIKSLRGKVVLPLDVRNGLYAAAEILDGSTGPNYRLNFGKVLKWGRMQVFYKFDENENREIGVSALIESPDFSAILRIERGQFIRHLLFMEYESRNPVGPGFTLLKSTFEEKFPSEGEISTGVPYLKLSLKVRNLVFYRTFFAANYYGVCFRLPTKGGILHLGLSYPSYGNSLSDLKINFGLSKKSILFDYLSTFN